MGQLRSSQGAILDRGFTDYLLTTVESAFPLQVVKSSIPGAGLGVVTSDPIPASWKIFKIKEPLVTQIESRKLGELCDRCFNSCKRAKAALASGSDHASKNTLGNAQTDTTNGVFNGTTDVSFDSASSAGSSDSGKSSPLPLCDKCDKCDKEHFCSMICQEAADKLVQKQCFQQLVDKKGMHNATLMAVRLSIRRARSNSPNERLSIDTLACHPEEQGGDTDKHLQNLLNFPWNDVERLKLMYFKAKTNALPVSLSGTDEICGFTLDAFSALINHSCDPNCYFVMEKGNLCFRALRDIPAGSELLISYIQAPGADVGFRRPKLLEKYRFLCQCPRCLGEHFTPSRLRSLLAIPSGQRIYNQTLFHYIEKAKTIPLTQDFLDQFTTIVNTVTNGLVSTTAATSSVQAVPHPLSTAWQLIAHGHHTLGDHMTAFKIMLNQCFVVLPRVHQGTIGPQWVASLHLLSESGFGAAHKFVSDQSDSLPLPAALKTVDWWQRKLVINVYRTFLIEESDRWCGADARFVRRYKRVLASTETGKDVSKQVDMVKAGVPGYFNMYIWGQRTLLEEMDVAGAQGVVVRGGRLVLG